MMNLVQYQGVLQSLKDMDILQLQNLIIVATSVKDTKEKMYHKDVEELRELIDRIRENYHDQYLYITTDPEFGNDEIDIINSKNIFVIASNKA